VSLSVHVFITDSHGSVHVLYEPPGSSSAAGSESWRTEVWASPPVRALGAQFFPQLAVSDLYVQPGLVTRFQDECLLLREHLDAIAAAVDLAGQRGITVDHAARRASDPASSPAVFRETVSRRLANIEDAARRAVDTGGGVLIW
jgi:hypothetical protein